MIRNKRTTFVACHNSVDTPTVRSDVPCLAAPIVGDLSQFHLPTQIPECPRQRKVLPKDKPSGTPER